MTNQSPKSKMMWDVFWSINHMYWYLHFVFARWDLEANPLSSKWVMCLPSYAADGFSLVSPVVCLLCSSLELTLSHIDANWAVSDVFKHQFYNCTSYFELLLRLNELRQRKNVCVVFLKSGQRLQNMIVSNVMSSFFPLSHMTECTMFIVNVILIMQRSSSSILKRGREK